MKRTIRTIALIVVLCLAMSSLCMAAGGYLLREKDGCLAVWDCSGNRWLLVTEIPVSLLPEADRARLKEGIPIPTREEIAAALEDFTG